MSTERWPASRLHPDLMLLAPNAYHISEVQDEVNPIDGRFGPASDFRYYAVADPPVGPDMTIELSAQSLTGIWHGIYSYPIARAPVSFVATLIETASAVSGTTHESCTIGGSPNEVLYATLLGSRRHTAVAFVKTYNGANPLYGTVAYEGALSPDGTEIEGRWTVPRNWSGKFLMIRSAGNAEAVARTVFERASSGR